MRTVLVSELCLRAKLSAGNERLSGAVVERGCLWRFVGVFLSVAACILFFDR